LLGGFQEIFQCIEDLIATAAVCLAPGGTQLLGTDPEHGPAMGALGEHDASVIRFLSGYTASNFKQFL
jgi:hypothetical protein